MNPFPRILQFSVPPILAGAAMAATIWMATPLEWLLRAAAGAAVYFSVLHTTGEDQVRTWVGVRESP